MADGRSLERFLDPAFDIAQDEGLQQACREMSARAGWILPLRRP